MSATCTAVLQSPVATLRMHSPSCRRRDSPASSSPLPSPSELMSDAASRSKHFSRHWPSYSATGASGNEVLGSKREKEITTHHKPENNVPSKSKGSIPERKKFRRPQDILRRILDEDGVSEQRESGGKVEQGNEHDCVENPAALTVKSDLLPPRKSRKKKKGDTEKGKQGKITTTKVRKLRVSDEFKDKGSAKYRRKAGAKSKDPEVLFSEVRAKEKKKRQRAEIEEQDLQLEKAIPRRKSWSPAPDTDRVSTLEAERNTRLTNQPSPEALGPSGRSLGSLLDDYGFAIPEKCDQSRPKSSTSEAQRTSFKKRKVDLVEGIMQPPKPLQRARKSQSPKKKPQTITAKATAPFAAPVEDKDTLNSYFGVEAISDRPECTAVTSRKTQGKHSGSNSKARGTKKETIIVLSPESAMKATREQRFVFGTSSQLVREDSPTVIEHLQRAMKDSEAAMPVSHGRTFQQIPSNLTKSQRLGITPSKGLWYAAARGHEVVQSNLENAQPDVPHGGEATSTTKLDSSVVSTETNTLPTSPETSEWLILDDTVKAPRVQNSQVSPQPETPVKSPKKYPKLGLDSTTSPRDAEDRVDRSPIKTQSVTSVRAPISNNEEGTRTASHSNCVIAPAPKGVLPPPTDADPKSKSSTVGGVGSTPNYKGYTEFELKRAIEGYGLKPIKSRNNMIERLEKCWQGKQELARQAQQLSASAVGQQQDRRKEQHSEAAPVSALPSPAKPATKRGRPKKAALVPAVALAEEEEGVTKSPRPKSRPRKPVKSKSSAVHEDADAPAPVPETADDEIYDSAPPTPSPPRRRLLRQPRVSPTRSKKPTPTPLTLSPSSSQATASAVPISTAAPPPPPPVFRIEPSSNSLARSTSHTAPHPHLPPVSSSSSSTSHEAIHTRLLTSITTAITSSPPSVSSSTSSSSTITTKPSAPHQLQLTWHEKILLYDPIVLDDLTAWLNRTGLAAVGEELEVDADLVKTWCEANGVCCLWRDGAGGKDGGRGGAGGRW